MQQDEAVASVARIAAPDVADKGASSTSAQVGAADLHQPLLHGMDNTLPQTSVRPAGGDPLAGGRMTECNCPARTCQPENNVGRFCWRSGFDIRATDFPDAVGPNE